MGRRRCNICGKTIRPAHHTYLVWPGLLNRIADGVCVCGKRLNCTVNVIRFTLYTCSAFEWLIISFPFILSKHLVLYRKRGHWGFRYDARCSMTINMMTGITSLFLVIQLLLNFIPSSTIHNQRYETDTVKCI